MNRTLVIFTVIALSMAAGCEKKEEPAQATAPTASAASAAPLASATALAPAIPTEEDFEEEAEVTVTAANMKEQLVAIEAQIK